MLFFHCSNEDPLKKSLNLQIKNLVPEFPWVVFPSFFLQDHWICQKTSNKLRLAEETYEGFIEMLPSKRIYKTFWVMIPRWLIIMAFVAIPPAISGGFSISGTSFVTMGPQKQWKNEGLKISNPKNICCKCNNLQVLLGSNQVPQDFRVSINAG